VKKRIDLLLVERGVAESRAKAQALLLAGRVFVDGERVEKSGRAFESDCSIRITETLPFVSRAGAKLAAALDHFHVDVSGRTCADLGASTGGFTDCLLQRGARSVRAFDVGLGQLDWKLRNDPRVEVRDEFNVRSIAGEDLPSSISLVTVDLSFISLTKVLEPLRNALRFASHEESIDVILLVKPQFEAGRGEVGKGGIVRDSATRQRALRNVEQFAASLGYRPLGTIPSPLKGAKGNTEFLLYLQLDAGLSSQR
jgi:23S rRNA (cytidine1920-2'-O)/16S rRNA (cytidine1409-2'-O)-methyltransferase